MQIGGNAYAYAVLVVMHMQPAAGCDSFRLACYTVSHKETRCMRLAIR
jgi:hypothetical protein